MPAPLLTSASRAARRGTATTSALLDVFAPAVFTPSQSFRRHRTTSADPTPSTSRLPSSNPSPTSRRPSSAAPPSRVTARTPSIPASSPRSIPRKGRFRPPVLETLPSAVDLLSRIRRQSSPPVSATGKQSQVVEAHNLAILSLNRGISAKKPDYQQAFQQGWLALCRRGMVGRVPAADVAKILPAVTAMAMENPDRLRLDWSKLRVLILWLCGETPAAKAAVVTWAWESLAHGEDGWRRVDDIFKALLRDEHKLLRETDKAPDFASRKPISLGSEKLDQQKMSSFLFAAAVSAQTLLRAQQTDSPSFASLLPSYLDRSLPRLSQFLEHSDANTILQRHVDPTSLALVSSTLRQISLAQSWYSRRELPAIGVWELISTRARAGERGKLWELWQAVQEGVDSGEVGWISVEDWDASAKQRWISIAMREDVERKERSAEEGEEGAAPAPPSSPPNSRPVDPFAPLPAAVLHQSIVAKFLSSFAYSQQFSHAEAVWTWLQTRSTPLVPGVVCWTGLINGYARLGDVPAVEQVFADMQDAPIEPDLWAWLNRVSAHFEAKVPDDAVKLVQSMKRDSVVLRQLEREFNGKLPEQVYNAIIGGLLSNGRRLEAEAVLDEMDKAGTPPSTYTLNSFIRLYTRGSQPDMAATARLIQLVTTRGLEANVYTFTMVLTALLQVGQKDAVAKTIAIMETSNVKPTVTTYGAIIASLAKSGKVEHLVAAFELLDEMEEKKMRSNEVVYIALIQGFLRGIETSPSLARSSPSSSPSFSSHPLSLRSPRSATDESYHPYLDAALVLKTRLENRGLRLNRVGYNALLSSALDLQNAAGVELALRLFKEMNIRLSSSSSASPASVLSPSPSEDGAEISSTGRVVTVSDTWYILLQGFARMRDWPRCHAVVSEMQKEKFVVKNKGLAKLVKHVTRREYQFVGQQGQQGR